MKKRPAPECFPRLQQGAGLIEVLVALMVLAIGILGYAGMQLAAMKSAEVAHERSLATGLAQDVLERMQANPRANHLANGLWPDEGVDPGSFSEWNRCTAQSCNPDQMARWEADSARWLAGQLLPEGRVVVRECLYATGLTCVVVSWKGQAADDCLTNSGIKATLDAACLVLEVAR
ncbi:type IV pilus modification protein PilV [Isoalcanivorax beigongshangi]|uniref:Type IV pilus modification protein PilV n=1 Tax=Isoalcanivorax beigongshangi TaxID=3238810 RepID=A0ABV4AN36_9GAMM